MTLIADTPRRNGGAHVVGIMWTELATTPLFVRFGLSRARGVFLGVARQRQRDVASLGATGSHVRTRSGGNTNPCRNPPGHSTNPGPHRVSSPKR
jgi:hypothetical protein